MKKIILILMVFSLAFLKESLAQTIHKNDLIDFAGILITTPINKPSTWPKDKKFKKVIPLKNSFEKYYIRYDINQLSKEYVHDWSTDSTFSILSIPNDRDFIIDLSNRDKLVLFRNNMHEGGASYLSYWEAVYPDSLKLKKIYKTPIHSGGMVISFAFDFLTDANAVYFVTEGYYSYSNYYGNNYKVYKTAKSDSLKELMTFKSKNERNKNSVVINKEVISLKFIHPKQLLVNRLFLRNDSLTSNKNSFFSIIDSKHEIFDLRDF